MWGLAVLLLFLLLAVTGAGVSVWFVLRAWKRRNQASLATKVIAALVAASVVSGAIGTVLGLVKAFGAVAGESVDPSQKARILAEGISESMNYTAFCVAIWVPGAFVLFLMFRRDKARGK